MTTVPADEDRVISSSSGCRCDDVDIGFHRGGGPVRTRSSARRTSGRREERLPP